MLLIDNVSEYLIRFADRLEQQTIVSTDQASKIRKFIRKEEDSSGWLLFLVFGALMGAITVSAGIYSLISHNWYDFPVWLRGILGFVPVSVALYFYFRMLTKHPNSGAWIEASSLFLMLMIGASIAITSQTYHMGGDYEDFILTMLFATVPLFYIKRASAIALFYMGLALLYLVMDIRINILEVRTEFGGNSIWFWIFVLALLPHYYLVLQRDKKVQSLRFRFLTTILYLSIFFALMISVESNRLMWAITYNVGFYLFVQRYLGGHFWFMHKLTSFATQFWVAALLLFATLRPVIMTTLRRDSFFNMDDYTGGEWYYFILLLVVLGGIYYNYFKGSEHYENSNKLIIFAPGLLIVLMILDYAIDSLFSTTWWWLISFIMNAYVFFLAVNVMVSGSEQNRHFKTLAGLFIVGALVFLRYMDVDMGFIWKGLLFLAFGGVFFLINMFIKEKVDQIERNTKRTIDGK